MVVYHYQYPTFVTDKLIVAGCNIRHTCTHIRTYTHVSNLATYASVFTNALWIINSEKWQGQLWINPRSRLKDRGQSVSACKLLSFYDSHLNPQPRSCHVTHLYWHYLTVCPIFIWPKWDTCTSHVCLQFRQKCSTIKQSNMLCDTTFYPQVAGPYFSYDLYPGHVSGLCLSYYLYPGHVSGLCLSYDIYPGCMSASASPMTFILDVCVTSCLSYDLYPECVSGLCLSYAKTFILGVWPNHR